LAKFNKKVIEFPLKKNNNFLISLLKNGEILSKKKIFLGPKIMHMGKGALKLRTSHGFKEKS